MPLPIRPTLITLTAAASKADVPYYGAEQVENDLEALGFKAFAYVETLGKNETYLRPVYLADVFESRRKQRSKAARSRLKKMHQQVLADLAGF